MSVGRWRLFAVVVTAACGGVLSLLRVSTPALSVGAMFGLLLDGTWAAWKFPNDVAISVYGLWSLRELFGILLARNPDADVHDDSDGVLLRLHRKAQCRRPVIPFTTHCVVEP